jgi:hypothetical protein
VVAIAMPGVAGSGIALASQPQFRSDAPPLFTAAAFCLMITYVVHIFALATLTWSFGLVPPRQASARPSDLMDLVPLRGPARFWGDTLGIFGAAMAIHLCCTPLIAAVFAACPFPTAVFWYLEIAITAILFLISANASRTLRSEPRSWSQMNGKEGFLLLLCFVLVFMGTTRVDELPDAVVEFFRQPSPPAWSAIVRTIDHFPLFIALALALYAGSIVWSSIQSSRATERA